ncbi:MAG: aminotransferase class V-fold PLP-dependent enzyme [Actinobacteria bacterium]|nr:aminotransferase class V-fold PLP-dependent enzyme [Actinomycetota bacterium]MCA1738380.1 aminotransferase class V-fold PLP-dependent enzyme [Actinomycetota bacterium]
MNLPRKLFPALASNNFIYLNSGGSGPPSSETISAMREADDLCSGPAYLEGTDFYAHQRDQYARAREAAARLVNVDPEDIALTQSTTHGMNLGTFALDWRGGDEVVSSRSEHPGCLVPLHALQERYGIKLRLIEPPITAEKVEEAMTPRTRLVSISHVDWTTGEVLPLAEISALARDRGALTLVDGAQSIGNIPVEVPATGVDMYAFTGHKWVLGPEGMGGLYVRPGLALEVSSTSLGFASLSDPTAFDAEGGYRDHLHGGARRFEASTMSPALAAGFATAASAVYERGAEGFAEIGRRADLLMDLLEEQPRVTLRSTRPAVSGLASFEIEGVAAKEAAERLLKQEFVVRFIPEPYPYVRASTHLFNTEEELEALAKAMSKL